MGSQAEMGEKPHAVCIPLPVQSHINAMLSVAKLLYQRGFFITFINTEYNHRRIIKSRGTNSLDGIPNFQFKTIPDGIPSSSSNIDAPQDLHSLCISISEVLFAPFCTLLSQLNDNASSPDNSIPPVSCIIGDGCMSFSVQAAIEFDIPVAHFWPISACSLLGLMHIGELVERGITPFKDESFLTDGSLETTIDWIPGMKDVRLKDLPSFIRTTDPNDIFLNFFIEQRKWTPKASAIILNTFYALDKVVLDALSCFLPPIYTVGPLHLFARQIKDERLDAIATNLWKEKQECINWLDSREPNSVIYINFGSLTIIKPHHLIEFAWGIANSGKFFLWIIRSDLVPGDSITLPYDFLEKTKERGMIAHWCNQEEVLKHPSIKCFLTHSGWNSTMESISAGVPMISWPFFGDQQATCRYCCVELEIALEIDNDVKREQVGICIKELMEGKKGEDMKKKIMELKSKAEEAYMPGGFSYHNCDKLIAEILLSKSYHKVK